jgi:hypothetical protein
MAQGGRAHKPIFVEGFNEEIELRLIEFLKENPLFLTRAIRSITIETSEIAH